MMPHTQLSVSACPTCTDPQEKNRMRQKEVSLQKVKLRILERLHNPPLEKVRLGPLDPSPVLPEEVVL